MTTPSCDANVCWPGFSPSRPRRSLGHPLRCRDSVGGHHHHSPNPRRASHPHGVVSRRAPARYRCRSAARKRPPGPRLGVGYRCYLKLGARYYNTTTARFTQPDPAHTCGGYGYAGGNPANNIDPTGRDFWGTAGRIAGDAIGCVGTGLVVGGFGGDIGFAVGGPGGAFVGVLVGQGLGCLAGIGLAESVGTAIEDW
jgi:hypothetical protein